MATFTVDVFTTLDGFGPEPVAYWGKEGPELLAVRARIYGEKDQTLMFAPNTYRVLSCTVQSGCNVTPFVYSNQKRGERHE